MTLNFQEVQAGGQFFKPEEQKDAIAHLVEVKRFQSQAPSKFGPKDAVYCDITVFASMADLDAGTPTAVFSNAQLQQTVLVKNLAGLVGSATVATVTQLPPKDGNRPAWAWASVSEDVKRKVIAYAMEREAKLAKAMADAPDFD